jgi:translation initiation factor eIF-2B subunit alpha
VGTFQIALVAKALGVPLYVAVESYKFARTYPLTQEDVTSVGDGSDASQAAVDLTPADLVRLMFTDLGTLTPAAVSDELIRLYQ